MTTEPVVSSDTADLRAKIVAELDGLPSEFIHPNEFGGYDVDNAAAADIMLAVVEPVLSELRAGFAQSARRSVAIRRDLDETLSKLSAVRVEQHDLRAVNDRVLAENRRLASDNVALRNAIRWLDRDVAALTARVTPEGAGNTIPDDAARQIAEALSTWVVEVEGEDDPDVVALVELVRSWHGEAGSVLAEIAAERAAQDAKWGQQNHSDRMPADYPVRDTPNAELAAVHWKNTNAARVAWMNDQGVSRDRNAAWDGILLEEVYEALAETDPAALRAELVQVAAVAAAWIEAIDRRSAGPVVPAPATPVDHAVTYSSDEAGHLAFCHGCKDRKRGTEHEVQDWGDAHGQGVFVPPGQLVPPATIVADLRDDPSLTALRAKLRDECHAIEGGMGVECHLPPGHDDWHNATHIPRTDGTESIGYPFNIQWPRHKGDRCAPQAGSTPSDSPVTKTGGTQTPAVPDNQTED